MTTLDPHDDLLQQLAARVRSDQEAERAPSEAAWSRRCLGEASDEEVAVLESLAEGDDEAAYSEEAFRPLGADFRQRLAEGARQRLQASSPIETSETPAHSQAPTPSRVPSPAAPLRRRGQSTMRLLAWAACLFLLVGGSTWFWRQGSRSASPLSEVSWATSQVRSQTPGGALSEPSELRLRSVDDLFLTLYGPAAEGIPEHRVSVFLLARGAAMQRLTISHEVRSQGKIELQIALDGIDLPADEATLVVAAHGSRYVTVEQVEGRWMGRLKDGLFGSWQRFEMDVTLESEDDTVEVEFLGCAEILGPADSPRCVLPEGGSLRLWVATSGHSSFVIQSQDDTWQADDGEPSGEGHVVELFGVASGALEVGVIGRDGTSSSPWRLQIQHVAREAVSDPERVLAEDTIDTASPQGAHDLSLLARRTFKSGNHQQAAELLERAAALHGRYQALSAQIDDLTLLFYTRFEILGEFRQAKEVLDGLPQPAAGDAASAYLVSYYRGLWALESGDLGVALRYLGQTARHAERLGWTSRHQMAEQLMARLLRRLGRGVESNALLTQLVEDVPQLPDCEKVCVLNNLAWDQLQVFESQSMVTPSDVAPTLALLEESLKWLDQCPRDVGDERINVQLNLALAYLYAQDVPRATHHIREVEGLAETPIPRFWIWKVDIEARLDLLAGRPQQALVKSRELRDVATRGFWLEAGWRAAVGEARAHRALGDLAAATEAYAVAESWLDEESRRVPLDADRAAALVSRSPSTAEYVELLLQQGAAGQAFEVARQARVRLYRSIVFGAAPALLDTSELASWIATVRRYRVQHASHSAQSIPGGEVAVASPAEAARRLRELEALAAAAAEPLTQSLAGMGLEGPWRPPALAANDAVLLYYPLPGGDWVGFAAHGDTLSIHRFESSQVLDDPAGLLHPFADLLGEARQVRVLPFGALNNLDFHALPLYGKPLAATLPVLYGLDLPVSAPPPAGTGRQALLLAAPAGDLPAAAAEVQQVRAALDDWQAVALPLASPQAVLETLKSSDLLHFAGHADFAGRDGLASHLRLAGDSRLSAKDLLATGAEVPEIVVLSACSSARSTTDSTSPGLGLAQAFLLRGSRMIVGATRAVDDRLTQAFFGHFYAAWNGTADDVPRALRYAQLELRSLDDDAWTSFRLLTR